MKEEYKDEGRVRMKEEYKEKGERE